MMRPDWKKRHPFVIGQEIYCVTAPLHGRLLVRGAAYRVVMRGLDNDQLWVGLEGFRTQFDAELFSDTPLPPPVPAVSEASEDEVA